MERGDVDLDGGVEARRGQQRDGERAVPVHDLAGARRLDIDAERWAGRRHGERYADVVAGRVGVGDGVLAGGEGERAGCERESDEAFGVGAGVPGRAEAAGAVRRGGAEEEVLRLQGVGHQRRGGEAVYRR